MKTKEEVKKSRTPSRGSLLSPPSPQGRGLLLTRFGREPESMHENRKTEGTKRECL
jgi:hypothetical protein